MASANPIFWKTKNRASVQLCFLLFNKTKMLIRCSVLENAINLLKTIFFPMLIGRSYLNGGQEPEKPN
jgi:hypothetical protein